MRIPHDALKEVDRMWCKEWVPRCRGTETVRHTGRTSPPRKEGDMGVYQLF